MAQLVANLFPRHTVLPEMHCPAVPEHVWVEAWNRSFLCGGFERTIHFAVGSVAENLRVVAVPMIHPFCQIAHSPFAHIRPLQSPTLPGNLQGTIPVNPLDL